MIKQTLLDISLAIILGLCFASLALQYFDVLTY